jgi:sarcosine oxidase subunit alpha
MTCRTPAAEGTRIETQNVIGAGNTDLLRATDWFFPDGMNHHELFAGIPGVQRVMQALARRIAGLGKLPKRAAAARSAARREADLLVVGAGPAGMATALEFLKRGRRVEVVDDGLEWGGAARALHALGADAWAPLFGAFAEAAAGARLEVRLRVTAAGIYGSDVLLASDTGVEVVTPRTLVLAPGAHDGVVAFEGNDVPGVMSARAGCSFAARGAAIGKRVVVVVADQAGPYGEAYARAVPGTVVVHGAPLRIRGINRVREVTVASGDKERRVPCDALLVDAPGAPAYELCAQAGAELEHRSSGFVVRAPGGKIRDGVFAVGEVVGTALEPWALVREAVCVSEGTPTLGSP